MLVNKIRKPYQNNTQWQPYGPFTWYNRLSFLGYTQPTEYSSSDFDFETGLPLEVVEVSNIYVNDVPYDEVATLALFESTEESWYFDFPNQLLYIHPNHKLRMDSSVFDTVKVIGYCTGEKVFVDENNNTYQPRVLSGITFKKSADRLVYKKLALQKNTLKLDNTDEEFDQYGDSPVPGSDINYLHISNADLKAGLNSLTPIYTGFSSGDRFTTNVYNISVQDKRSKLSMPVPSTIFNDTDYPNISNKVIGKTIPEGYGDLIGIPAFCTDGTITTGNVSYKYATDGTSITTVYVKVDDDYNSVTPVSTDPTNGEIVLSSTDARDSSGNPRKVKVDARLRDYDSPGSIIKDMIYRYLNHEYILEYFNITQWEEEEAYLADIYFYMGKEKTFIDYIEKIQSASDYGFMFDYDENGKYIIKVDDLYRDVKATIPYICNIDDEKEAERDFEEYATSIRVNYAEDQESKDSLYVIADSLESAVEKEYRKYKQITYPSCLKNSTDAQNKADLIAIDYSKARLKFPITLDTIAIYQIYDIIVIDTSVYKKGEKVREYLGPRKIKLSKVSYPSFNDEKTKLTGYDITDIV